MIMNLIKRSDIDLKIKNGNYLTIYDIAKYAKVDLNKLIE